MRHVSVISGYRISIDFHKLTGWRRDPRVLGCHSLVSELKYTNT